MHNMSKITLALAAITLSASMYAQAQTQKPAEPGDRIPSYRVSVVSRSGTAGDPRRNGAASTLR